MIDHDLSGDLSERCYDEFCGTFGIFGLGADKFRLAYEEEYEENGYDDEPGGPLLIRRESDGAFFEVELEATVRPAPSEAEREALAQRLAGQMELPEVAQ